MPSIGTLTSATDLVLGSYLKASVTATSTAYIDSGLAIQLAANTAYYVSCSWANTSAGDGMQWRFQYTGTTSSYLIVPLYAKTTGQYPSAIGIKQVTTTNDESCVAHGLIRTGTAGTLYVQFAKNTDVTTDTTLAAGACLVARRI